MSNAGWKETTLDQIATIEGGGTPSRTDASNFGKFIDWVTPTDLAPIGEVRLLGSVSEGLSEKGLKSCSAKKLPAGTVLFSSRASIGKIAITDRECATNQGFVNLIPRCDVVDPWFLAYLLCHKTADISRLSGETTYKEVSRGKLKSYSVKIPSLPEQRRIMERVKEMLDRVDEIRTLREESLMEAEGLLPALIESSLKGTSGEDVLFGEVVSIEGKLVDPREKEYRKLLHVGGANIVSGTGKLINLETAEEEELISGKYNFTKEDVLYSKIRPYLRKVVRPDFDGLCSADIYPLHPRTDTLSRSYLFYLLLSQSFTDYANRVSNRAGMPKINRDQLFGYRFILPDIERQNEITQKLDEGLEATMAFIAEFNRATGEVAHIQESILLKAFAGEL